MNAQIQTLVSSGVELIEDIVQIVIQPFTKYVNIKIDHGTPVIQALAAVIRHTHDSATKLNKFLALQRLGVVIGIHVVSRTVPYRHQIIVHLIRNDEVSDIYMTGSLSGTCPAISLKTCGTMVILLKEAAMVGTIIGTTATPTMIFLTEGLCRFSRHINRRSKHSWLLAGRTLGGQKECSVIFAKVDIRTNLVVFIQMGWKKGKKVDLLFVGIASPIQ